VRSTTFGRGGTGASVTVARNREQWRRAVKKDEEAEEDEAGGAVRCLAAPRAGALYRGRGRGVSEIARGGTPKLRQTERERRNRTDATAAQKERVLTEARLDATFGNRREQTWPSVRGSAAIGHGSRRGQRDATISQGFA
jgi:hypothetical protein